MISVHVCASLMHICSYFVFRVLPVSWNLSKGVALSHVCKGREGDGRLQQTFNKRETEISKTLLHHHHHPQTPWQGLGEFLRITKDTLAWLSYVAGGLAGLGLLAKQDLIVAAVHSVQPRWSLAECPACCDRGSTRPGTPSAGWSPGCAQTLRSSMGAVVKQRRPIFLGYSTEHTDDHACILIKTLFVMGHAAKIQWDILDLNVIMPTPNLCYHLDVDLNSSYEIFTRTTPWPLVVHSERAKRICTSRPRGCRNE